MRGKFEAADIKTVVFEAKDVLDQVLKKQGYQVCSEEIQDTVKKREVKDLFQKIVPFLITYVARLKR